MRASTHGIPKGCRDKPLIFKDDNSAVQADGPRFGGGKGNL